MAIAVGSHTFATSSASNITTTTGVTTTASGSTFLACVIFPSGDTFTSVTDSKSNTYILVPNTAVTDAGDGLKAALYYCQNGTGGASHTATLTINSTDPKVIHFIEITGGLTSGILDASSGILDLSTPFDSSVTITQANELIISLLVSSSTIGTFTFGGAGGFTALDADTPNASLTASATAYRTTSATGSYSPAATSNGPQAIVLTAAFKEAGGGGGGATTNTVGRRIYVLP